MTYIPASLRQAVAERAQHKCEYCRLDERYSIFSHEIDHIVRNVDSLNRIRHYVQHNPALWQQDTFYG